MVHDLDGGHGGKEDSAVDRHVVVGDLKLHSTLEKLYPRDVNVNVGCNGKAGCG